MDTITYFGLDVHKATISVAVAESGHACQPKIGGVGQDSGEQRVFVIAGFAGAQIGERGGEARFGG